ncbi:MAG: hypothetical protein ABIG44_04045 [Planctomycetota bacterium]
MRSFLLLISLTIVVAVMILKGVLPRQAGASGSMRDEPGETGSLKLDYVDYEDEGPLLFRARERMEMKLNDPSEDTGNVDPTEPGDDTNLDQGDSSSTDEDSSADESWEDPDADYSQLAAEAGADRVVWLGLDEIQLDGSKSIGDALTYSWKQIAGSHNLKIANPNAAQTSASGFPFDWGLDWDDAVYEFELTVSDAYGQESVDCVQYEVKTTPPLRISPWPKRELILRDGYYIARYESWETESVDSSVIFTVRSRSELFLQHLGGDNQYELNSTERAGRYTYEVTLFFRENQPATWVEFFVDTDQRIPAILQFGVNWE